MKQTCFAILAACAALAQDASLQRRREALEIILKNLPHSSTKITGRVSAADKSWEDWQRRTGELPPDFDAMPSSAALPDPLAGVRTPAQWQERRKWIREQFEKWIVGKMPPKPDNLRAVVTGTRHEGEVTVRDVRLEFGPGHRGILHVQLMIPPGKGPFPVFLTNHPRNRPWVATAVRRGYIGAIYFATDPIYGNPDDSDAYIELYPEYDFSCLARWAWAGMRAVDYLVTLPEVDKAKIAISGHSRNGKQAIIAAAFDDRIGAVIPSSGNTGEGDPWRYTTDMFVNESIEQITGSFPHWFHPRLRFFAGREDKLPVDENSLMALVAPRGLMLASAYSETQGNPFGFEQNYRSIQRVYRFLGHEENLGLYLRPGEHPTTAFDIERFIDFTDTVFGRKRLPKIETWVNGYTFDKWREITGEKISRPASTDLRAKLRWALGDEPAGVRFPATPSGRGNTSDGWLSILYNRPVKAPGVTNAPFSFGDDLKGDLYYPAGSSGRQPIVIWLHPYSYPTGYSRYARPILEGLTKRGFAVLAFDQIGFGTRVLDAKDFYLRYPKWSLMGKMVADTRAAVDAVSSLDRVDPTRIYIAGYALGAKVALFTAALEERVRGVASIAGFTLLRHDAGEGLAHYSHLHGLMPRLGFYIGREKDVPLDYDEILQSLVPRHVLVVAPALDRYANLEDVRAACAGKSNVELRTPVDFNRFPAATQQILFDWLANQRE